MMKKESFDRLYSAGLVQEPTVVGYVALDENNKPISKVCKRKQDAKALETKSAKARISSLFKNNR